MSGTLKDKLLLYRLQIKRDPDSFAILYDRYVDQIYRFVYFKVSSREEAEDVTSEVFLKAWHYVQERKEIKSFTGLLYRIARNCIIDLYRRKSAKPEESLQTKLDEGFEPSDKSGWEKAVGMQIETERVVKAIKKLKQEYQEVITLKYVDELEITEIAEIVNKSAVTIRVTLHRAIKKLQELLEE